MRLEGFTVDAADYVRIELRGRLSEGEWGRLPGLIGRDVTITVRRRRWWHRHG